MLPTWWKNHLSSELLKSHDGFHEIPYLSNTPEIMFESLASMPHSTRNLAKSTISADNQWMKGCTYYQQIEEGLWIGGYTIDVRSNLVTVAYYDGEIESDYYYLSYALFKYPFPLNKNRSDFVYLNSATYTFYKPKTPAAGFFYENTNGLFFNIIFTKKWFMEKAGFNKNVLKSDIVDFLDGKMGILNLINVLPDAEFETENILSFLKNAAAGITSKVRFKKCVNEIVSNFFIKAAEAGRLNNNINLHSDDFFKVATAEKIILNNLSLPFIGVESLAKQVHLSPTSLKQKFKMVYGFSMLQYHKEKNILLALQLLQNSDLFFRDVASITGYNSLSKFTAAFKKRFGVTPSEAKNKKVA